MMNRQNKILILGTISVIGISYYGYRAIKRNQTYNLLLKKVSSGSVSETNEKANQVLTGNFHKSINTNKSFVSVNESKKRKVAEKIYNAVKGAGTKEEEINSAISSLKDKIAISQVASYYQAKYNVSLLEKLKDELRTSELQSVIQIVNNKPDVRWLT